MHIPLELFLFFWMKLKSNSSHLVCMYSILQNMRLVFHFNSCSVFLITLCSTFVNTFPQLWKFCLFYLQFIKCNLYRCMFCNFVGYSLLLFSVAFSYFIFIVLIEVVEQHVWKKFWGRVGAWGELWSFCYLVKMLVLVTPADKIMKRCK